MARFTEWFSHALPGRVRAKMRELAFSRRRAQRAKKLARTSKRLDLCAAHVALLLHLAGLAGKNPLRRKCCMELGSGWVLSYAVLFHLLGAERIIATDIERNALPSALHRSLHEARKSNVRDILAPFEDHHLIRERLDRLLAVRSFSFDALKEFGIEYVAPVDLAARPLGAPCDYVFSFAVLEHVPVDDVLPLLQNLSDELTAGGQMLHCVHLEDHRSPNRAPFRFLAVPQEEFTREQQSQRGNRLRRSQWREILSHVEGMDFRFLYEWSRRDRELPPAIDPSVRHVDEEDLRVSHLGLYGCKKPSGSRDREQDRAES